MTTTPVSITATNHPAVHNVDIDGKRIGRVTALARTYRAARRNGQSGVDIRRIGYGFRSLESAAEWIAKGDR